jgi:regulator of RNase E activity RraA
MPWRRAGAGRVRTGSPSATRFKNPNTGAFTMTAELDPVSRLLRHPTSVVSDALDELGIAGVLVGVHSRREGQGRVAGMALPVHLAPKTGDPAAYRFGGGVGKPLEQVLKTMKDGDVVLMDLGGSLRAAAWGGLASRIAQRRGVRGTILWGCCRDVEEIRQIGYPVWSVATCPRRSRNDFTFGSINEPVTLAGVTVAPRDYVLADESGVVIVPRARIAEVLELCERIAAQEERLEAQVLNDAIESWDAV